MNSIVRGWKQLLTLGVLLLAIAGCGYVPSLEENPWKVIEVPTESKLLDITFADDLQQGWLVGSEATILKTEDSGETWQEQTLELPNREQVRLSSVSFAGDEGWIVGEPSVILHTEDRGETWSRLTISEQLPGEPRTIAALGPQQAEMITTVGAIYRTEDGGQNWQAMVQDAAGVIRNISRSPSGEYVAVSSRGNFYSTWQPGQQEWESHQRNTSRRLQNMGYDPQGHLWLLARGGQVQLTQADNPEEWTEPMYPEFSTSWGLLDLAYRTDREIWVVGGSAQLLYSPDRGKNWYKDKDVEEIPANFYRVKFFSPEQGFAIGQQGILLKYAASESVAQTS